MYRSARLVMGGVFLALFAQAGSAGGGVRVLFLPFNDQVRLSEAWVLGVDVPRWFSETADTVGSVKPRFEAVPFDSSLAVVEENRWPHRTMLEADVLTRLAGRFGADVVVCGTVRTFRVSRRSVVTDGRMGAHHELGGGTVGRGGTPVMGGLYNYTATVRIDIDLYGPDGCVRESFVLDSEEKDGGLKVWTPMQMDSDQFNFYYLSRTPFGSPHFQRSVIGHLMRDFSRRLGEAIAAPHSLPDRAGVQTVAAGEGSRAFVEGKILGRSGDDVYIDLGIGDNLFQGELFEVLAPTVAVVGETGDTLGWMEEPVALIRVRSLKSAHFSQATIVEEAVPVEQGWTVRVRLSSSGTLREGQ